MTTGRRQLPKSQQGWLTLTSKPEVLDEITDLNTVQFYMFGADTNP